MKAKTKLVAIGCLLSALCCSAFAQGTTAFTYQGQLHDTGTNANGNYTMIFALYDASTNGDQIAGTITTSAALINGLFSVDLDFGAGAFSGDARWLDITITNSGMAQELSPRVQLLPAPYAQFAAVAATVTNGAIMNAQLSGNSVATTNIQNGAVGSSQLASNLTINGTLDVSSSFQIGGTNLNINVENVTGPAGSGISFNNALVFSADGLPFLDFANWPSYGPVVYDPGALVTMGLTCEGSIKVKNASWNTIAQIDSSGNISSSGYVSADEIDSSGNISAAGNITTAGNITASYLNAASGALALGSYPDWSIIYSDGNGGLSVEAPNVGEVSIDPSGINISGTGFAVNVNNAATTIDGSGNINTEGAINCFILSAQNGIACDYLNVSNFINTGGGIMCGSLYSTGSVSCGVMSASSYGNISCTGVSADSVTACEFNYSGDCESGEATAGNTMIASTSGQDILTRVAKLKITTWNSNKDPNTHHVGPTVHDFQAAFDLGKDGKTISLVDENGVALAAIQGLNEKLKEKDDRIEALEKRLADLEQLVKTSTGK